MDKPASNQRRAISFFFSTTEFTGAAKMGFHFALAFQKSGYEVTATCGARPSDEVPCVIESLRAEGITVIEETGFSGFFNIPLLRRIHHRLKQDQAQAVVCMFNSDSKIAGWAAKSLGIPFFVSAQNHNTFFGNVFVRSLKKHIYSFTMRTCATKIVCTSEAVRERLEKEHWLPPNLLCILPNGIDVAAYGQGQLSREALRASLSLPAEAVLLVNVGRIGEQKGQQILVQAFAAIHQASPSVHLLLVGEAASDLPDSVRYAAELRDLVGKHSLQNRVHFLGWRDDIADILGAGDIYVHSALWEGWALAPLEAMAGAVPTIMTDCSGTPEGFVDGVDGYVVSPGKTDVLAAAMRAAIGLTPVERAEMGLRGRRVVTQNYDVREIGRKFVSLVVN